LAIQEEAAYKNSRDAGQYRNASPQPFDVINLL